MKKRLDDLFDEASAKELDTLMENKTFSAPLDDAVLARIEKQTLEKSGLAAPKAKKRIVKRALLLAATFALLLAVTLGAVACAAEQKEYREAIAFFEEHNLSTMNLTRSEIKAVYRDITWQRFTYSKTAEVIEQSVSGQKLEGVEILPNDPRPEEVKALWQAFKDKIGKYSSILQLDNIEYRTRTAYITDEYGNLRADAYYIEKFDKEELCWSLELEGGALDVYPLSDGVLVNCSLKSLELRKMWNCLFKISDQGEIVWRYDYDESLEGCFEDSDDTILVLSREIHPGQDDFIVRVFSAGGELLQSHKNEMKGNIRSVSRVENGYLLVLVQGILEPTGPTYGISRVDLTGKEIESYFCSSDTEVYAINDVIEYGGKIYFSADVKTNDDGYELSSVVEYAREKWNEEGGSYTDETVLQMMRECYAATLMVCDPISGEPKEFYTQKGAFGGALSIDKTGSLNWCVESIVSAVYQPYYSSCHFNGFCYVYQYAFDTDGKLLGQVQTEMVIPYMK